MVKIDISGNIQIFLQEKYYNKTCGLCGNFNKFAEDDFRTQEGKTVLCALFLMGDSTILLIQKNVSMNMSDTHFDEIKSCLSYFIFPSL